MWNNGRILFIVNPNAGWHNGGDFKTLLGKMRGYGEVSYDIKLTEYSGHARVLAEEAVACGDYGAVVAVGGDGTVNEVGSVLVGSDVAMGVIPLGRGNGFARHLGYSMRARHALKQLLQCRVDYVDVLDINGTYSFNVSGIGFDALVAHVAAHTKVRGVFSYIWAVASHFFKYGSHTYKIVIDGKPVTLNAFLMSFANTDQYGNNVVIAPRASVQDGFMELCVIDKLRNVFMAGFEYTRYLLMDNNPDAHSFRMFHCREAEISGKINIVHIDGEPMYMQSPIRIKVLPGKLKMLIPRPEPSRL